MKPVTDPAILSQLNAVTDPDLIAKLEGTEQPIEQPEPSYLETVKGRLSSIVDPETYKGFTDFPPYSPETAAQLEGVAKDVAIMAPTTAMSQAARLMGKPAKTAAEKAKQQVLKETGEAGYYLPKSNIKANWRTNLIERFGGKQAIEHVTRTKNQPITNSKAAKALGLSDDVPITPELLSGVRAEAGKAYEALKTGGSMQADKTYFKALDDVIEKFSGASKDFPELANKEVGKYIQGLKKPNISINGALEQVKNMRHIGNKNYKSLDPALQTLGKAQKKAADILDDLVGRSVGGTVGKDAFKAYQEARKLIAKTHTVEDALVGSDVAAAKLARDLKKGAPLSGALKEIAKFGQSHPNVAKIPRGQEASGGALEPLAYGMAGIVTTGSPAAAASAAIPIIGKPIARHLATKVPQSAKPSKIPGILENALVQKPLIGAGVTYDRSTRKTNRNSRNR